MYQVKPFIKKLGESGGLQELVLRGRSPSSRVELISSLHDCSHITFLRGIGASRASDLRRHQARANIKLTIELRHQPTIDQFRAGLMKEGGVFRVDNR